jgi:N-acetylglucosamine-6-phosphate deacetylase
VTELHGRLLVDGALRPGRLVLEGARIAALELDREAWEPERLPIVAPGLIDLHIHGFALCDPLEDLAGMAGGLARAGTTAFLPTLFPAEPERLGAQCASFVLARAELAGALAAPLGLHLEGPFVNPLAAGALPVSDLATPSVAALRAILGPATGDGRGVSNVTLAPELPGSAECIEELVRSGVRVSLGHSRATAREAAAATRAGAAGVTHLYNAMSGVQHRGMGLAGLALTEDLLFAEIIGDLVHVEREAFELALRARGPGGLCLVSDALGGAGTGCQRFHLHGREHLIEAGTAYYPPGPGRPERQFAGSAMSLLEMVQRLTTRGVLTAAEALTMAATTPARALGVEEERGVLRAGARADLLVLDGAELELRQVWMGGEPLPPGPC